MRDNVYQKGSPIQVVPPDLERLKYREEFFVVVQFGIVEGTGEWDCDVQKIIDEPTVEVCKAEEMLHLSWLGPISDDLHFVSGHSKAFGRQEVFDSIVVELAFLGLSIQAVLLKSSEYFFNLLMVSGFIGRVDKDIIKVDNHTNIEHICEDVVHEALEGSGCIGQAKGHHHPLKGSILGSECCLPFVTIPDPDEMVGMPQINLGVDPHFTRRVEEVGY